MHARSEPGFLLDEYSSESMSAVIGYGGDTLNTCVYLARLNTPATYLTALGDDPMSQWMIEQWQSEGVDCSLVQIEAGAVHNGCK